MYVYCEISRLGRKAPSLRDDIEGPFRDDMEGNLLGKRLYLHSVEKVFE